MKNLVPVLVLISLCLKGSHSLLKEQRINCRDMNHALCEIRYINTTGSAYYYSPVSNSPDKVLTVKITASTIPIFDGTSYCSRFKFLTEFYAQNQGIQQLKTKAFKSCQNLKVLYLTGNNIKAIENDLFSSPSQLTSLNLHGNEIVHIAKDAFTGLTNLKLLSLYSNNLIDLDATKLTVDLPKLKEIYLQDNLFSCDRFKQILQVFQNNSVQVWRYANEMTLKNRTVNLINFDGYSCLAKTDYDEIYVEKFLEANPGKGDKLGTQQTSMDLNERVNFLDFENMKLLKENQQLKLALKRMELEMEEIRNQCVISSKPVMAEFDCTNPDQVCRKLKENIGGLGKLTSKVHENEIKLESYIQKLLEIERKLEEKENFVNK